MARALPPLNWFRSFEAAARHLNFTMAAEELSLTQSAVSQQVRLLELRLGVPLFVRKARGLAITDDGRRLLPQVGSALETLGAAAATFDAGPTEGLLTVAASVSVAQWVLAPRIGTFLATRPGLRIRIVSTIWPDELTSRITDAEIRFGSDKQVGRDAARLGPDALIAVARDPPAGALPDQVLIEAVGAASGWAAWGRAAGIEAPLSPTLFVDSHGLALTMAAEGQGVALTSSWLAAGALRSGAVRQVHGAELPSADGYFLAVNRTAGPAQDFARWLTE
jgi:LysR family glycine cleavage system transcriptional activator